MANLKMEIEKTHKGPVLKSFYGDRPDASYRPATSKQDLRTMVMQVLNEWFRDCEQGQRTNYNPQN